MTQSHSGIAERELPRLTEKMTFELEKMLTEKGIVYKHCIQISKCVSH